MIINKWYIPNFTNITSVFYLPFSPSYNLKRASTSTSREERSNTPTPREWQLPWRLAISPYCQENDAHGNFVGVYVGLKWEDCEVFLDGSCRPQVSARYKFYVENGNGNAAYVNDVSDRSVLFWPLQTMYTDNGHSNSSVCGWGKSRYIHRNAVRHLLQDGQLVIVCQIEVTNVRGINIPLSHAVELPPPAGRLKQHLHDLINDDATADVQLKVNGKIFKVHKCILSARSPVFKGMFSHATKENLENVIDVDDTDPETMQLLLEYIYTGICDEETLPPHAQKLLIIADKYLMEKRLKFICGEALAEGVNNENVFQLLQLSDQYDIDSLKRKCFEIIKKKYKYFYQLADVKEWRQLMTERPELVKQLLYFAELKKA